MNRTNLEVNPGCKLEVSVSASGSHCSKLRSRRSGRAYGWICPRLADPAEPHLIRNIQAVHLEDKLHPLRRDVEGPAQTGVRVVGARIPKIQRPRRRCIANLRDRCLTRSRVGIRCTERMRIDELNRSQILRRDAFAELTVDARRDRKS